ncbi:MAG: hypothetical protein CSA65_01685 [Proteobacteria bacterium]|nr:MAG: hypothetical protein CSA65_01685 [Pseudomonadota bacterium]
MAGLIGIYRFDGAATDDDLGRLQRMVEVSLEPSQFATSHRVGPLVVAYLGYRFERERLGEHLDVDHPNADHPSVDVVISGYLFNDREVCAQADGNKGPKTIPGGIRALYLRDPDGFVERLNGRFQVLIYDHERQRLTIASDRHGLVPNYVRRTPETFDVASSLVAHTVSEAPLTLDRAATTLYLMYRHFVGEGTYFEEVSMPPVASVITVEAGEVRSRQYWRYGFAEAPPWRTPESHVEEMGRAFEEAIARVAREPGSIAVPLSGGLDSRAISAQLCREGRAFSTFTFGREGCRDIVIAKAVTAHLGVPHHVSDLGPDYLLEKSALIARRTDGAYPVDHGHIAAILDAATPANQVAVDGLTGEMLSSERVDDTRSRVAETDPERVFALISKYYQTTSDALVRALIPDTPSTTELLASGGSGLSTQGHTYLASLVDLFCDEQRQRRFCLCGPRILGGDLRVFCPFYHYDYADSVLSASPKQRAVQRPYIMLHRKMWPEMARIRWNKTGLAPRAPVLAHRTSIPIDSAISWVTEQVQRRVPLLPQLVPFKGYERYNRWFRHDAAMKAFIREVLLDPRTRERGVFGPGAVRKLIEDQERGRARNADTISQLIATELFFRQVDAVRAG